MATRKRPPLQQSGIKIRNTIAFEQSGLTNETEEKKETYLLSNKGETKETQEIIETKRADETNKTKQTQGTKETEAGAGNEEIKETKETESTKESTGNVKNERTKETKEINKTEEKKEIEETKKTKDTKETQETKETTQARKSKFKTKQNNSDTNEAVKQPHTDTLNKEVGKSSTENKEGSKKAKLKTIVIRITTEEMHFINRNKNMKYNSMVEYVNALTTKYYTKLKEKKKIDQVYEDAIVYSNSEYVKTATEKFAVRATEQDYTKLTELGKIIGIKITSLLRVLIHYEMEKKRLEQP